MNRAHHFAALVLVLCAAGAAVAQTPTPQTPAPMSIVDGSSVQIEYTLKDDTGTVLDTNKGQAPLRFTQGEHEILPELEKQLTGMRAGDEKKVTLKPEDGYGVPDPNAVAEVPKEVIPEHALKVGTRLMARSAAGESRSVTVKEVKDTTVVLDLNHPLAGKTLVFDVKVLGVDSPKTDEPKPDESKSTK
jgi:FKBP-type peptidyl-prolyl cis-trans isomerase SlyD